MVVRKSSVVNRYSVGDLVVISALALHRHTRGRWKQLPMKDKRDVKGVYEWGKESDACRQKWQVIMQETKNVWVGALALSNAMRRLFGGGGQLGAANIHTRGSGRGGHEGGRASVASSATRQVECAETCLAVEVKMLLARDWLTWIVLPGQLPRPSNLMSKNQQTPPVRHRRHRRHHHEDLDRNDTGSLDYWTTPTNIPGNRQEDTKALRQPPETLPGHFTTGQL